MDAASIMGYPLFSDTKDFFAIFLIYCIFEEKTWEVSFAHAISCHKVPDYYLCLK